MPVCDGIFVLMGMLVVGLVKDEVAKAVFFKRELGYDSGVKVAHNVDWTFGFVFVIN